MTNEQMKQLCLALMHSEIELEVIQHLQAHGLWDKPDAWRWLGDEEFNYSSVGNQQSRAEQAIVEKLVNSVDAKLICEARIAGFLPLAGSEPQAEGTPKSIKDARQEFFGKKIAASEDISKSITVAATAKGLPNQGFNRPCFTIADDGEGQTPKRMPDTILSLHKGNKDKIRFAQGKFNMGGTGVLEFCGMDRNIQLVISKRHPKLIPNPPANPTDGDWSFTIIRREDPTDGKSSRFAYLAPVGCDHSPRLGQLLHFTSDTLPIFPDGNTAYAREGEWGTLVKLIEYDARRFKTNMMLSDGLMYRARLMLPEPALPMRFYECRPFKGSKGSFNTPMPGIIMTLKNDYADGKRDNVDWYDKLQFVVEGETFSAELFLFKDKKAADSYKREEGLLFTYNGQCHATMTKDFFRRKKVKQDYLWHSLLMFVDCSKISTRSHERLFMNSRDRLRDGDLKAKLETAIEQELFDHSELKQLASERRKKELSEDKTASESMAKVIENLISKNPLLAAVLGQGARIKNPHKPEGVGVGVAGFIGKRFPTKFHFKGKDPDDTFKREANVGSKVRLTFETDAANDYFKRDEEPGELTIYNVAGGIKSAVINYQKIPRLMNGMAHLSMELPAHAAVDDMLDFVIEVNDPSRPDPIECKIQFNVKPQKQQTSGTNTDGSGSGTSSGQDKGSTGSGSEQSDDSYLDIPDPHPVYEKDWNNHEPYFDRLTAIRVKDHPEAKDDEDRYDFFINMDNIYLQTYMKAKPKEASSLKLRFSVGMTLIALSVLHQDQQKKKAKSQSEDMPSDDSDVRDRVAATTSAIAPFLLPMIDSVSVLNAEDDYLSEDAGEAA